MSHYKHLTLLERENIWMLKHDGWNLSEIAKELGCHKSTISRELRRNGSGHFYRPSTADSRAKKRREACRKSWLLENRKLYELVATLVLEEQWSPEQIAMRIFVETGQNLISTATIYRAFNAGAFDAALGGRKAKRRLRRKGRRKRRGERERRGKLKNCVSISERPSEAETRERLGDWEGDTVVGSQGGACLVTLVDRKSRFLVCGKAAGQEHTAVNAATSACLSRHKVETITFDHGKEFAGHEELAKTLNAKIFFALPRHPWQRGTNENTNGLLREYFPKRKPLDDISEEEIQQACDKLNNRPRC